MEKGFPKTFLVQQYKTQKVADCLTVTNSNEHSMAVHVRGVSGLGDIRPIILAPCTGGVANARSMLYLAHMARQ